MLPGKICVRHKPTYPPIHTGTRRLTTTPRVWSCRGLINKILPFSHVIPAPLSSSCTSAARTKRDYRKQWSWNLILFDSGNTMSRMSLIPLVLLRQSCKRKTGGFFNLLQSISLHVSGFYFWCLNWKGITPPSLWNNLSPSLEADSTVLIFISLFVFFMTCFTKTLADLFELRSSLPTEEA